MELDIFEIKLTEGQWAHAYKERLRITVRLHQAEMMKCMVPIDDDVYTDGKAQLSKLQELETMPKPNFLVNALLLDNDAINEIYILHQVKSWSFGPVDKQTLDKMPDRLYKELVEELDRLYKPIPLS